MSKVLRFVTKNPQATATDLLTAVTAIFGPNVTQLVDVAEAIAILRTRGELTLVKHLSRADWPDLFAQLDPDGRLPGLGVTLFVRPELKVTDTGQTDAEGNPVLDIQQTGWQGDLAVSPAPAVPLVEQLVQTVGTQVELPTRSGGTFTAWRLPDSDVYWIPDDPDRTWDREFARYEEPPIVLEPELPPTN